MQELFPERVNGESQSKHPYIDNTKERLKIEENVIAMINAITINDLLKCNITEDRGLVNTFTGQVATPEQTHDLLNFRSIGETATQQYITHQLLNQSSSGTTIHKKKLLTMSASQKTKKRDGHLKKRKVRML